MTAPIVCRTAERSLTPRECRDWLASHHEGRLGYRSGCGDRAVVVTYAMADDQVVFRVPEYSQVYGYAVDASVTLDVAGPVGSGHEAVVVSGRTHAGSTPSGAVGFAEDWPPGVQTHVICLPLTAVVGTLALVG